MKLQAERDTERQRQTETETERDAVEDKGIEKGLIALLVTLKPNQIYVFLFSFSLFFYLDLCCVCFWSG